MVGATPTSEKKGNNIGKTRFFRPLYQIRINYPLIAWRLEVAAIQTKSACADFRTKMGSKTGFGIIPSS
jgi:hypothetical protein